MHESRRIPWLKISAEGVAIVLSILLAFAIDASWQEWQQTLEGKRLADALAPEILEHQDFMDRQILEATESIEKSRAILDVMASSELPDTANRRLAEIGNIFVMEDWKLTDNVYQQSVSSGKLLLIRDEHLRFSLADYHSQLANTLVIVGNMETQYYLTLEPFMTRHTIYTEVAHSKWLEDLPIPPFKTDFDSLARNTELWNLIAFRMELDLAYRSRLEHAREDGLRLSEALKDYSHN